VGSSFDVRARFEPGEVVVTVRGEVDQLTAPVLAGVLDGLAPAGPVDVVLDLDEVSFLDAAGLGVIAHQAVRLRSTGKALRLRSPSPSLRRLLDLTSLIDLVEAFDQPARLGPVQRETAVPDSERETPAPVEPRLAALGVSNDVVDAALRLVTALTSATVEGADGVSVSLHRHGRVVTVAASDDTIAQMDRDQYSTGEGPCLSAAAEGLWFHVTSLRDETRWPSFVDRALQDGIASILSSPLTVDDLPVGALNIYSTTEGAFGPHEQEMAALFASQASGILTEARVDQGAEDLAVRFRLALQTRELIAQAEGAVMAQQGIAAEDAASLVRRLARRNETTVREQSAVMLEATLRETTIERLRP